MREGVEGEVGSCCDRLGGEELAGVEGDGGVVVIEKGDLFGGGIRGLSLSNRMVVWMNVAGTYKLVERRSGRVSVLWVSFARVVVLPVFTGRSGGYAEHGS